MRAYYLGGGASVAEGREQISLYADCVSSLSSQKFVEKPLDLNEFVWCTLAPLFMSERRGAFCV